MDILLLIIPLLYLVIQLWQLLILFRYQSKPLHHFTEEELPSISIWVACRNEENNIGQCLESLLGLEYPSEKIQILVGNDQSTDRTKEIIESYAQSNPQITCVDIVDDDSLLKAKARVMAQLDVHAKGDFYLITDADVKVNPLWIQGLLSNMSTEMGVCSGTTMVKSPGLDGWLQEIDWAYFMGLLNVISYSGVPATAVGNNMIIRKQAYWETGGYKAIRFSITEDYKLYSEVCKKGWKWNNIMNRETLAFSEKTEGLKNLLHQRKRWLSGGKELPWYWWLLFGIYGGFYFNMPALLVYYGVGQNNQGMLVVFFIWLIKWLFQNVQVRKIYAHLSEFKPSLIRLGVYELYLLTITTLTAIFFVLPLPTIWKGRNYRV